MAFTILLTVTAHKSGLRTLPAHHHDGNGTKFESVLFTLTTVVVVVGGEGTRVHCQTGRGVAEVNWKKKGGWAGWGGGVLTGRRKVGTRESSAGGAGLY